MIIPEVIIHKGIESAKEFIWNDLQENSMDETKSLLYDMFGEDETGERIIIKGFDYFEQSKNILEPSNRREFETFIGYNLSREGNPTVHILLPDERMKEVLIGDDEGYRLDDYAARTIVRPDGVTPGTYRPTYHRRAECTYHLLITSANYNEVIILYHFLKYVITGMSDHYGLKCLDIPNVGGTDVGFITGIIPTHIYQRKVLFDFSYDFHARSFSTRVISPKVPLGVDSCGVMQEFSGEA